MNIRKFVFIPLATAILSVGLCACSTSDREGTSDDTSAEQTTLGGELRFLDNLYVEVEKYHEESFYELANFMVDGYVTGIIEEIVPPPCLESLVKYLEDLPMEYLAMEHWDYEQGEEIPQHLIDDYHKAVRQLQRYADGEIKQYPAEELMGQLRRFYGKYAMIHSEWSSIDGGRYKLICFRLLQQMVRYIPDIKLIAQVVSPDGRVAIMAGDYIRDEDGYDGWFNPIFFRNDEGDWLVYIKDDFMPTKIYPIEHNGEQYYLLSHHGEQEPDDNYFDAGVFHVSGDRAYVSHIFDDEMYREWVSVDFRSYNRYIFNPRKLCWNICEKRGEYYYSIEGTKTLYLRLDEDYCPRFCIE